MQLLMPFQHVGEILDALGAGLGFFSGLNPEQDSVAITAVEGSEKCSRPRIGVQRRLEIGRHGRAARRVIGSIPTAVALGALDFLQTGRRHPSTLHQQQGFVAVDFGPDAPG